MEIMLWSKKWSAFLFAANPKRSDFWLALSAVFLVSLCVAFKMPFQEALQGEIKITLGYSAKQGSDGEFYVLDNGHERLTCFDNAGNLRFTIENPSDMQSKRLYIDDFWVSKDGIYLSATEWNKMRIVREAILHYDTDGCYVNTILERDYKDNMTNKHRFYGIGERDGRVQVVECFSNSILTGELKIPYANAFNAVSDAVFAGNRVYVLSKNGNIRAFSNHNRQGAVVYRLSTEKDENVVPYRLAVDGEGNIYFTDIRNCVVRRVDMEKGTSEVVFASTNSLTVNFADDGALLLVDDSGLHIVHSGQTQDFCSLKKNSSMILLQIVWIAAVAVSGIMILMLVIRLICCFFMKKRSIVQLIAFWVVITVTAVSLLLCGLMIKAFEESYREKIEEQVESAAYMVANQISGSDIDQIEETGGFGGAAYNRLYAVMEKSFSTNIAFYGQLYCNILKLPEQGGNGYAVAYLDQSVGTFFPLNSVEQKELEAVYDTGSTIWNERVADISGTYLSVKVPVFGNDKTVKGVVAVGVETYVITDILRDLVIRILMSIIIILMLVYLLSVEVMSVASNHHIFTKSILAGEKDVLPGHLIRPLVFLIFASYNMTATFLPVYLIQETDVFPERMRELAGALPITVNIFIIGVMSLFCARLVRKFGMRKMILFSAACSLSGNLLIYSFPGFYTICIGLALDGVGVGGITNAIYVLLAYIKEERNRTWGLTLYNGACLSGINFGMILGSLLAATVGRRFVFGVAALAWALMAALSGFVLRKMEGIFEASKVEEKEEGEHVRDEVFTGSFLLHKPVLGFIVLIQNPYIIFGSFVFYYVPVYCSERGYSETICSLLIMLYSQAAVLCADKLTEWIFGAIGNYAVYAAFYTNIAALALFAAFPNIWGMAVALLLMGIGASYGKTVQQKYYLGLKASKQYGEDKSMGIYNFSENIGESLGPVVFGKLMAAARLHMAVGAFCSAVAGLGLTHYFICGKELRDGK